MISTQATDSDGKPFHVGASSVKTYTSQTKKAKRKPLGELLNWSQFSVLSLFKHLMMTFRKQMNSHSIPVMGSRMWGLMWALAEPWTVV